jgi:Predicted membrane protein (DUF2207)
VEDGHGLVGDETLTVDVLTLAAVAAWLLAFGWCAAVTRRPARQARTVDPGPGLASAKPALVNLAVTRCRLNGAAYPATILDLAEGGYLAISERVPGQLWCDLPTSSPPGTGLARSERLVLSGARAVAGGRGAPFEALAESCASDVRGRWNPFERAVRAEGRRAGVTRRRLPAVARLLLYIGAGVVGAAAFAAVYGRVRSGLWAPTAAAFLVFAVLAYGARSLGRQDRLTAQGEALGGWAAQAAREMPAAGESAAGESAAGESAATGEIAAAGESAATGEIAAAGESAAAGEMAAAGKTGATNGTLGPASAPPPAGLSRLALAIAAGAPVQVPGVSPALAAGIRPGHGRTGARTGNSGPVTGTLRPSMAWSSFGGHWRLVRIRPASFTRVHPAFWLVLAIWLALMAYASSLLPGPAGLLAPAVLTVGSAAAAVGGARGLAARMARPAEASFQAQVIARWVEHTGTNDNNYISCFAVDDGERSWSFDVSGEAFAQLALGDAITVRASPRSGKLLGLTPDQDRTGGATLLGQAGAAATDEGPPAAPAGSLPVAATDGEPIAAIGQPGAAGGESGGADGESGAADGEPATAGSAPATAGSAPATAGGAPGGADGDAGAPSGAATTEDAAGVVPPGALLSAGEVSAAVGRPVRATGFTPGAASVVYRGEGITVVVTVADGFLGSLIALARRRGQPLAGVGDEAWLLNRGRTAVLLAGGLTAKITAGGSATRSLPPDALARLAAAAAERLPRHVTLPGRQA